MHRRAVFTRNHRKHLDEACERKEPTAFQSEKKWSGAQGWLKKQKTLKVYIAPVGDSKVEYEGIIVEIALKGSDPEAAKKLLGARGEETNKEDDWGETVYLLKDCRKIPVISQISLSELEKAKDGTHLSENYKYSYSIVLERDTPPVA